MEYMKLCSLKKNDTTLRQVAIKAGISPQNLSHKVKAGKFYYNDIEKIADALGADVKLQFIDRQTGEAII